MKNIGYNLLNPDYAVTTENTVTVKGVKISYKAIGHGSIPVWNDSGKLLQVFSLHIMNDPI
ncbi:MAG: hypothetical protein WKF59_12255 [Chitinophagaceae bacterium]